MINDYRADLIKDSFEHTMLIMEKYVKQLIFISSIDEKLNIGVLLDGSIALEFFTNEMENQQLPTTIAIMSFVIPHTEQFDEARMDEEQERSSQQQQNEQPLEVEN